MPATIWFGVGWAEPPTGSTVTPNVSAPVTLENVAVPLLCPAAMTPADFASPLRISQSWYTLPSGGVGRSDITTTPWLRLGEIATVTRPPPLTDACRTLRSPAEIR